MAAPLASGWGGPRAARLPDGRLHLQHGPIDLVIEAKGEAGEIRLALGAAWARFQPALGELVEELGLLRRPLAGERPPAARSPIARRMIAACWPLRRGAAGDVFITPMAAVAGAVADEIKAAILAAAPGLATLYVNNGGDIALHAAAGARLRIGLVADLARAAPEGVVAIEGGTGIGGVATSGWRGRSFSLGVADAATVLAESAAAADAAATIIANAVDIEEAAVERVPAGALDPDSDLGALLVTIGVGPLSAQAVKAALDGGIDCAGALRRAGLIEAAAVSLQGEWRILDGARGFLPLMP